MADDWADILQEHTAEAAEIANALSDAIPEDATLIAVVIACSALFTEEAKRMREAIDPDKVAVFDEAIDYLMRASETTLRLQRQSVAQ